MLQCLEQTVFAGNIKKVIFSGKKDKPLPNASSYPSSKELTYMFSGLIGLSLWIYIFICLLVSRQLQKIRETARLWWSALPTPTASPAFPPSLMQTQRESVHFANNSQTLSVQQRDWLILLPDGKKKHDILLIIKTPLCLAAKRKFNII